MMINDEFKWVNAITDAQMIFLIIAYFYCFYYLQVCRVQVFTDLLNRLMNFLMCTQNMYKLVF